MADIIQLRRDTAANWTAADPVLAQGEIGIEIDTLKLKIGDGVTAWTSLAYYQTSSATGTVESVALSVPTGLEVSGSPITTTGTFTVTYATGYSIPTTAKQSEWDMAYSWGNHADAGYLTGDNIGVTVQGYSANLTGFLSTFSLPDTDGSAGYVLTTDGDGNLEFVQPSAGSGTVTSVGLSVPTGLSVSGSPVTGSGTLSISYQSGYSIPTTAKQSQWDTAYSWGNHADAGYLTGDNIGVTVQGYDAATAKTDEANTWLEIQTFKSTKDIIYTITDGPTVDINPANGGIQIWALGGNRTPTATNFENGQSVTLMIDDGSAYTITWAIVDKWFGGAPTLSTDELTGIVLFKAGGVMYGTTLPEVTA